MFGPLDELWEMNSPVAASRNDTYVYLDSIGRRKMACQWREAILVGGMIRGGFLDPSIRADLIALVRDGKAETRLTRRANALLLLDDGMSCEAIAKVLYLDDDTIRYWYQLYGEKGLSLAGRFRLQGPRLRTDGGAAGRVERLGGANVATDQHHGGRVDREVLWRELHPFGAGQALGADGGGISQAAR